MIQGRPDSKEKVTNSHAEFGGGLGVDVDSLNEQIRILVVLGNYSALAIFDQGKHPRYLIKMFLGPIEFEPNSL
jgi:hypothetical protein